MVLAEKEIVVMSVLVLHVEPYDEDTQESKVALDCNI